MPGKPEKKPAQPDEQSGPKQLLSNQWSCDSLRQGQKRMKNVKKEQLAEEDELKAP